MHFQEIVGSYLNIVECKGCIRFSIVIYNNSSYLNIVECKEEKSEYRYKDFWVVI